MKVTVVGSGDAFGSDGRSHTCFRLDVLNRCVLVDFGASAIVAWQRLKLDLDDIDAVVLTHLHGDHFGGLPFLLLQRQFERRRNKPLHIFGPPGARARIDQAVEIFYPGVAARGWSFDWSVTEIEPGGSCEMIGLALSTQPVVHFSGASSTGVRLSGGGKTFAYSGDTEWTPTLETLADGADLFIVECYSGSRVIPGHLNWPKLRESLPRLAARRIALTHMGAAARRRAAEYEAAGLTVLDDGLVIDI